MGVLVFSARQLEVEVGQVVWVVLHPVNKEEVVVRALFQTSLVLQLIMGVEEEEAVG